MACSSRAITSPIAPASNLQSAKSVQCRYRVAINREHRLVFGNGFPRIGLRRAARGFGEIRQRRTGEFGEAVD